MGNWHRNQQWAKKLRAQKMRLRPSRNNHKWDSWDLSQERQFMENLVSNRFNYFMLLYGVILVYAYSTRDMDDRCVILCCGASVSFLMALAVHRVQVKLDYILKLLNRTKRHPTRRISRITRRFPYYSFPMTWVIGTGIPFISAGILIMLASVSIFERSATLPMEVIFLIPLGWVVLAIAASSAAANTSNFIDTN